MNVLVTDDYASNRTLLREQLEADGMHITEAADGIEALAALRGGGAFDAVITDILMPRMDGYRLCHAIRADARLSHLPIIVFTASYTSPTDEKLSLEVGADLFLRKPAPADEISRALRHVVHAPRRVAEPAIPLQELQLVKEYSERLVSKLESKNIELAERTAALEKSEERLRELAETLEDVFWIVDAATGAVLYVSPAYARVWGRSCEDLYRSPQTWFEVIHPDDRARVRSAAGARLTSGEYREEYRVVRPDGTVRWVIDRASPVRDAGGAVCRIVGVAVDITERKDLEAQFLRAQRMEAIGSLAGGIAHDLNNILAPLTMAAPLLREMVTNPDAHAMLAIVETSAKRGAGVVQQLLQFARGAGTEQRTIQARHLLNELIHLMHETFPRNIEIEKDVAGDLLPVNADATQLHQVLLNLCVNARDAMPDGGRLIVEGRNLRLDADAARRIVNAKEGTYVVLAVRDTGCGIQTSIIDRIFDPFFTTKTGGKGTGLGLATVLTIVKNHNGFVTVGSQPGKGATFCVYLPAAAGEAPVEASTLQALERTGNGETILIVDDEETIRSVAQSLLEKCGYRTLAADNGASALELFRRHEREIRLVLTDVMMPAMDGLALARALRARRPELGIIVTTGQTEESKIVEFAALGITDLLIKPCSPAQLLDSIRRLLAPPARLIA